VVPVQPSGYEVLSAHDALELLEGAARGSEEVLGALGAQPMIVVDLDPPAPRPLKVPPLLPAIVLGVAEEAHGELADSSGLDLLITSRGSASPWVETESARDEIAALGAAVRSNPIASVTLAQVLRVGEGVPVATGLAIESLAYSTLQAGPEFAAWDGARARPVAPARETDAVLVERVGGLVEIVLNRPRYHNAYNAAMRDQLCEALAVVAADHTIEQVVLRGNGPSFCSGGDLREFGTRQDPATAQLVRTGRSPARLIATMADRITARVHGFCVGSGMELPAFAGTVQADRSATFRLPEVAMGLIPGAGGTTSLPRRIGRHRTMWMGLSGRPIDAQTAMEWGLVDALVEAEMMQDFAGTGETPRSGG
jgi:enoyl-CoA hydratase/carnithine racemase